MSNSIKEGDTVKVISDPRVLPIHHRQFVGKIGAVRNIYIDSFGLKNIVVSFWREIQWVSFYEGELLKLKWSGTKEDHIADVYSYMDKN